MTDYLNINFENLGNALRKRASGMRQLARETIPGDFQSSLLALDLDYDLQAVKLEQRDALRP
jgi:hypothetical protein